MVFVHEGIHKKMNCPLMFTLHDFHEVCVVTKHNIKYDRKAEKYQSNKSWSTYFQKQRTEPLLKCSQAEHPHHWDRCQCGQLAPGSLYWHPKLPLCMCAGRRQNLHHQERVSCGTLLPQTWGQPGLNLFKDRRIFRCGLNVCKRLSNSGHLLQDASRNVKLTCYTTNNSFYKSPSISSNVSTKTVSDHVHILELELLFFLKKQKQTSIIIIIIKLIWRLLYVNAC